MKTYIIALVCLCCLSCNHDGANKVNDNNTPKALQEGESTSDFLISKRGSGNLVEELYNNAVEKDPKLKKLEADIAQNREMENDSLVRFNNYRSKSDQYYSSADINIKGIKDSVLRKAMKKLIDLHKAEYDKTTNSLVALMNNIDSAGADLDDDHIALQIITTLPLMGQYQKSKLPDNKELTILLAKKKELIDRTKNIKPVISK